MARSTANGPTPKIRKAQKIKRDEETREDPLQVAAGYGCPPVHSQFTKGKSGNPKGRPKGAKSLKTLIRRGLMRTIVDPETKRKTTVAEALLDKQVNLGLKGSSTSTFTIFKLADQLGAFDEPEAGSETDLSPSELTVLEDFLSSANKKRDGEQ